MEADEACCAGYEGGRHRDGKGDVRDMGCGDGEANTHITSSLCRIDD